MEDKKNSTEVKRFMGLLVPNQKVIHAFILYLVPNRADADDILQDTLTEMWNKFEEYRDGTNFVSWAVTIARFKVYHFLRSSNRCCRLSEETLERLQEEAHTEPGLRYFQERIEVLKDCVTRLPDKEQRMLRLRYERNLTFEGVAERFGVSMQAAYKAISQIHAILAKCVQRTLRSQELS